MWCGPRFTEAETLLLEARVLHDKQWLRWECEYELWSLGGCQVPEGSR